MTVTAVVTGCGVGGDSPSQVFQAAYTAANEKQYDEADQYLSAELLDDMNDDRYALFGGKNGLWDQATRGGAIKQIEIVNETIQGSEAAVSFRLHFVDGRVKDDEIRLVRESGRWKLANP